MDPLRSDFRLEIPAQYARQQCDCIRQDEAE